VTNKLKDLLIKLFTPLTTSRLTLVENKIDNDAAKLLVIFCAVEMCILEAPHGGRTAPYK